MDAEQFTQIVEILNLQQQQMAQLIQTFATQQQPTASSSDTEVRNIIKGFKCEKYDTNTRAEVFLEYFEAQCRMWGLNKHDNTTYKDAKRELFLSCLKPDTYKELKTAFANVTPKFEEQSYEEISKKFLSLFQVRVTRFKALSNFWNCTRLPGQSFEQYANVLKEIATQCKYEGTMLDRQLRDRFATGLKHKRLEIELKQKWPDLLNSDGNEVTFAQVFEVAQAREAAEYDYDDHDSQDVSKIQQHTRNKSAKSSSGETNSRKISLFEKNDCLRCGNRKHADNKCPAFKEKCRACNMTGHFERVCLKTGRAKIHISDDNSKFVTKNKKQKSVHKTTELESEQDTDSSDECSDTIAKIVSKTNTRIDVELNGIKCTMEWDPGAAHSIINKKMWKQLNRPNLADAPKLKAYGNFELRPMGITEVDVTVQNVTKRLNAVVMPKAKPMLFGLPWHKAFKMPFPEGVYSINTNETQQINNDYDNQCLETLINDNKELFDKSLGKIKDFTVKLHVKPDATPVHIPARPIKFGIQKNVEAELKRLEDEGIISQVDPNEEPVEWATPTVNVPKKDGRIRICGDFRSTINPVLVTEKYPIPLFDHLRCQLAGGNTFSRIDLKDAYLQFEVHPKSRKYLTISTHKGYYQFNRLPFGIVNAPSLFCRYIERLLEGIPNVAVYFDDIAVTGRNNEEHLENLKTVFNRLNKAGLKIQLKKCSFLQPTIEYLGHEFSKDGIKPTKTKLDAIRHAVTPTNTTELKSFLGFINFYERFIPNLQAICADLHDLCKKGVKWHWSKHEDQIFNKIKQKILNSNALVPYDDSKQLFVASDASEKGVGAVLYHVDENRIERPIAFASRKLNDAEQQYSVIDREALAIYFAIKKFDQYLQGNKFVLVTDHKPLEYLLGPKRQLQKLVNKRLTRWALYVGEYDYDIVYRQGKFNTLADFLSRMPSECEKMSNDERTIFKIFEQQFDSKIDDISLTQEKLRKCTRKDALLMQVIHCLQTQTWNSQQIKDFSHFYSKRQELSVEKGILMWQGRIVVPDKLKEHVLDILHCGHPGVVAMRALSRYYVWWIGIDKDVENYVRKCMSCQESRQCLPEMPLYSWSLPETVWERLHVDFAGPFEGTYWLIVVDALSKWADAKPLKVITAQTLCHGLDGIFTYLGLPQMIVSDNGRQFTSHQFQEYCVSKGIKHVTATPYHPKTNGLAERFVRTFKSRMKASKSSSSTQFQRVQDFLFHYRNTPHGTTGKSPNEMMFGRRLRTLLDNVKPNVRDSINFKNVKQQMEDEALCRQRSFVEGENVYVRTNLENQWSPGKVTERTNRYSYKVLMNDGVERRRHADNIRKRQDDYPLEMWNQERVPVVQNFENVVENDLPGRSEPVESDETPQVTKLPTSSPKTPNVAKKPMSCATSLDVSNPEVECLRRSSRERRQPKKLSDYVQF